MDLRRAIKAIDDKGALLIFPMSNRKVPPSLWYEFHPRSQMRWEWDEGGDNRVSNLWFLREQLSVSKRVIYTKWYRGRATVFSKPVFIALVAALNPPRAEHEQLSEDALTILRTLETDSPLSTKALRKAVGLTGRANEGRYERALKELWARLLISAYGEVDEGAFPSLAIGATSVLFEDLWQDSRNMTLQQAEQALSKLLPEASPFISEYFKVKERVRPVEKRRRIPSVISSDDLLKF